MMHGTHNVTLTPCNMMHGTHNVALTYCNMMHGTHNVTLTYCNMMHGTHNVKLLSISHWEYINVIFKLCIQIITAYSYIFFSFFLLFAAHCNILEQILLLLIFYHQLIYSFYQNRIIEGHVVPGIMEGLVLAQASSVHWPLRWPLYQSVDGRYPLR